MLVHNIVLQNLGFNQYEMRGVCYSDEDHPLEFYLEVSGKKQNVEFVRVPAIELIPLRLKTYDRAFFQVKFTADWEELKKLAFVADDMVSGDSSRVPVATIKNLTEKNFQFYCSRLLPYLKEYGFRQFLRRIIELTLHLPESPETQAAHKKNRAQMEKLHEGEKTVSDILKMPVSPEDLLRLAPSVLIIAEMSIPQCKYYRVEQKIRMFESLGVAVDSVSWTDKMSCFQKLQQATLVIFYRVPLQLDVFEEYAEARRLGLKIGFDVDDLIFDLEEYSKNKNLQTLKQSERASLMEGALMYQAALKNADFSIASTPELQRFMRKYCKGPSYCVPNAIMDESPEEEENDGIDTGSVSFPLGAKDEIIIGYGSGTSTHDHDFELCSDALAQILEEYPKVSLTLHGKLQLPAKFSKFRDRIHRVEFVPFSEYSQAIRRFDINLIPLEQNCFNDCKSNIKYLEASKAGIPSVASPCAEFRKVIVNGENGFLAENTKEWYDALKRLVESPELRKSLGAAARKTVYEEYDIKQVGPRDLLPILKCETPGSGKAARKRVLIVNVLYPPISFGGATVVAENIVDQYEQYMDTTVFCMSFNPPHYPGFLMRYHYGSSPVFMYEINADENKIFSLPEIKKVFSGLLDSFRPDLVHFHSIQHMGVEMLDCCLKKQIPYVVTAHDAWWICERQFMLDQKQNFCHQDEHGIDMYKCAACTQSKQLFSRWKLLQSRLMKALLITTPSDYMRDVYVKSGTPADLIRTNHNGIKYPEDVPQKHSLHKPLTFAYLGGNCHHKGYYFLMEAVKQLHGDYLLKLVDINLKFNTPSINKDEWPNAEQVEICLPYDHHSMDSFYNSIDVLLFPSKWKESFGLTIREALARNIWVISTKAGGDIETDLKNGINGNIVPMYDTDAFRQAMQNLIDHPETLQGFENPYRKMIRTPEQQFAELKTLLKERSFLME